MSSASGYLTTHVLDTVSGLPAAGVRVTLYSISGDGRSLVTKTSTNGDGRTDDPLISKGNLQSGLYELEFDIGEHFTRTGLLKGAPFLDSVPIRFKVDDENLHYHVPLLASPFSYTTYRGS